MPDVLASAVQTQDGLARVPDHRKNSQASGPTPDASRGPPLQEPVYEPIYNDLPTVEEGRRVYQPF